MRKFLLNSFILAASFCHLMFGSIEGACDHHLGRTENNLPIIRLALAPDLCLENNAIFLLGELGEKNYRANGTYGFFWGDHRFKIGGEWLTQRLKYNFLSGKEYRWVNQAATGLDYEYAFDCGYLSSLDASFDYAHAFSQRLSSKFCEENSRTLFRRIAGASNYHGSLGVTLKPWCNSKLYLSADYDSVRYNRKLQSNRRVSGYGGTAAFNQRWDCIDVNLKGEFRRPYTYYEAQVNLNNCTACGIFTFGVFANHTHGRDHLPSITAFGIQIAADLGSKTCSGYSTNGCESDCCTCDPCNCANTCELLQWVSEPAVYYPLVLAIADQSYNPCAQPTSSIIPDLELNITDPDEETLILATAPYFNANGGAPLTYSITVTSSESGGPFAAVAIDPNTGVLTLQSVDAETLTITVNAANECGSTSQTFTIALFTVN